jgi:hypothetical protein
MCYGKLIQSVHKTQLTETIVPGGRFMTRGHGFPIAAHPDSMAVRIERPSDVQVLVQGLSPISGVEVNF